MSPAAPSERNARIGAKIRRQRQVLGWDQRELAERVGVHVGSVQKWEAGKFYPGRKLGKIEAVLGISLEDEPEKPDEPEGISDELREHIMAEYDPELAARMIAGLERLAREPGGAAAARSGRNPGRAARRESA